jgi:hypothetical protein
MRSEYGTAVILSIKNREEFSRKLDFHWFPVDQWVFEVFSRRIRVSRIEIPQNNVFSENSIFIGSWSTNGVSRPTDLIFEFPTSSYLYEHRKLSQLVSLPTMFL